MDSLRIKEVEVMKVNITSSIDISSSQKYLIAVTRQIAKDSSRYIYRLGLYELGNLKKIKETDIYRTYSEQKHFCKIMRDERTIVVTTKYHIIFYSMDLEVQFKALHQLENIYDLEGSPDGRIALIVGDNRVFMWNSANYRTIKFDVSLPLARFCRFSPDNKYLLLVSTTKIYKYDIEVKEGRYYEFVLSPKTMGEGIEIDTSFGLISSIDFHPYLSNKVLLGFSNVSPRIYDFDNPGDFVKILAEGEQPQFQDNYKQAVFLPDGKRIFTSDHKEGVGLWPSDPTGDLHYKEDYLFYGYRVFDKGRRAIGFVWERIKVIEIEFICPEETVEYEDRDRKYKSQCSCRQGQFWDPASYSCSNCNQNNLNICSCGPGERFKFQFGRCVFSCDGIANSVQGADVLVPLQNDARCFCLPGYFWENGACVFDCKKISHTTGKNQLRDQCNCFFPLIWDNATKVCECPQFTIFDGTIAELCRCDQFHESDSGRCVPDCSRAENAIIDPAFLDRSKCPCPENYIFTKYQLPGSGIVTQGCLYNCSTVENVEEGTPSRGCQCQENMLWTQEPNSTSYSCTINCPKIRNAIAQGQGMCKCTTNYLWVPENMECGRNCSQESFVNHSKHSTAVSCPCQQTFEWNSLENKCIIDCDQVNYTESYSLKNTYSCVCRQTFYWDPQNFSCVIDCGEIWDAKEERIGQGQCKCNNDKEFNETSLICQTKSGANEVFNQPWVWVVLAIGVVFVIVVAIIMIRYCRRFSQKQNNEHAKTLKKLTRKESGGRKNKQRGSKTERKPLNV